MKKISFIVVGIMRLKKINLLPSLWVILSLLFLSPFGSKADQNRKITQDPVKWSYSIQPNTVLKIGDEFTVTFTALVDDGWHIYSVTSPALGPKAMTLNLDKETTGLSLVGKLSDKVKPIKAYDEVFETDIFYFKHKAEYQQKFKVTQNEARLVGFLDGQVCTEADGACIPIKFELDIHLKTEKSKEKDTLMASNSSVNINYTTGTSSKSAIQINSIQEDNTKPQKQNSNIWVLFITAFLGGLLALITPCVFPLIPMTVSFFTKRSKNRQKGITNAFIYAFFIIFIFTVLGLLVTILFGENLLNDISTNPWVNLVFFLILFLFGLSFLGLFEITLPSSWATKADTASEKGGIVGIFFMALTLVIASFSCTGVIAGGVLVEAASGKGLLAPTIAMLGFSSGLALPFGLFALFPGWLNSLPRSGGWLNAVKVVLGFLEVALSLKFLSQSDLTWEWHFLNREVFIAIWISVFALLGIYLLGKLRLPHDTPLEKVSVQRVLLSMISFSFVFYLLPGLWGAPLPHLSGLLPPPNPYVGVRIAPVYANTQSTVTEKNEVCSLKRLYADKHAPHTPDGFCAFYDLDEALAYAKNVKKPLFIDFTGINCANCRQVEQNVWPDPAIKKLITEEMILVSLYTDDPTRLDSTVVTLDGEKIRTVGDKFKYLQKTQYGVVAQPYYVIVDNTMKQLVPAQDYTSDVSVFRNFLESGVKKYKESIQ